MWITLCFFDYQKLLCKLEKRFVAKHEENETDRNKLKGNRRKEGNMFSYKQLQNVFLPENVGTDPVSRGEEYCAY